MATWNDVRRLALALPGVNEETTRGRMAWLVDKKLFVWERPLSKADVKRFAGPPPEGPLLGVRTEDLEFKEVLLASDPAVFLTIAHFDGYPAVLVRLAKISVSRLRTVVLDAWLARAKPAAVEAYLAAAKAPARRKRRG